MLNDPLIQFVVVVIVVGFLIWLVNYILDRIPVADPFNRIARVAAMVIGVLYILLRAMHLLGVSL